MLKKSDIHRLWKIESMLSLHQKIRKNIHVAPKKFFTPQTLQRSSILLDTQIGNNAFSWYLGKILVIPPCIFGDENDIELGNKKIFEDIEDGQLKSSHGLKTYVYGYTKTSCTPIYICDNHNSVLEAWQLILGIPHILVHIDAHKDDGLYTGQKSDIPITVTQIHNYISYSLQYLHIFPCIYSYTQTQDIQQLHTKHQDLPVLLNIDLDVFDPLYSVLSYEEIFSIIFSYLPQTSLITLATSPLFINQEYAQEIGKLLWRYL